MADSDPSVGVGTPITITPPGATVYSSTGHTHPQLPLDVFRSRMGNYHPWHFWQMEEDQLIPVNSACNSLVREFSWQNSTKQGRDEIRKAIYVAESRLREHLGYSVGRRWVTETLQIPRPEFAGHMAASHGGTDARWVRHQLGEGFIRAVGVEARTLIATANVVYSDADGDGLEETWTVTVSTDLTDPDEIEVYFSVDDRLDGEVVSERWRIAPVAVKLENGVGTIKGRSWLMARPILYQGVSSAGIDPTDSNNLVTQVEVYRHFTDSTGTTSDTAQAVLVWETPPYPGWAASVDGYGLPEGYSPNSLDPAAIGLGIARVGVGNAVIGEVTIGRATYDATTGEWSGTTWGTMRQPDRVIVRYEAGAPYDAVENTWGRTGLDGHWSDVVARFAASELSDGLCSCDDANRELYRWQFDHGISGGGAQSRLSDADLRNPFGTRAGAVYAWQRVRQLAITHAVLLS